MANYLKVEGSSSLVRDADTKAILNNNNTEYQNYLRKREMLIMNQNEINNIKEDILQIKQMLCALIEKDRQG
jgi:type IV secretory pathway component VirB8